jgi:transcriptional regulator with GAF, ATPase, and Fis domain
LDDLESPSAEKKPSFEPVETAAPDNANIGTDDSMFDVGYDDIIAESIKAEPPSGRNPKSAKTESTPEAAPPPLSDAKAPKVGAESKVQKTRQVGSIEKIFRSLNSEQQLTQVLGKVLKTLQKVVPFDLAVLMTRKAEAPEHLQIEEIVVRGAVKSIQYNHIPYKGAEFDAVMKTGKSLTVDDTSRLKGPLERKMFCKHGLTSCLIIPLSINGKVAGVLTLGARRQKIFRRTRQYVEWVGNGISLAIERDRLALESRQRGLALNVTIQILQTLIAMKFDISKVLSLVFELIQNQMNVEAGCVYLADGKTLTLYDGFNANGKPIKQRKLALKDAIAGQVVKQGAPILVNDMSRLRHTYTESSKLFDFQTRSVLSVPLGIGEKIEGVIEVRNKRQGDYKAEDELLMQAIGTAVAIALESARCYKEKTDTDQQKKEVMASLQKLISKNVEQMAAA